MKYTQEQLDKIIEMYNANYSLTEIGKEVNRTRKHVSLYAVRPLIEQGILQERNIKKGRGCKTYTKNNLTKKMHTVIALYNDGKTNKQIEEETGININYVNRIIRFGVEKGWCEKREREKKEPKKSQKLKRNVPTDYIINDTPIKCTRAVAQTCIFGSCFSEGLCNFISCTGKARITICPPDKCTVYQKVSKTNPRRKALEDICGYAGDNNGAD